MSGVNDIDASAIAGIEELIESYGRHDVSFAFAGVKGPVRDRLVKAGWTHKLGKRTEYMSLLHALKDMRVIEDDK
jgi:SulP family sulfate permease